MRIGVLALLLLAGGAAAAPAGTDGGDGNAGSGAAGKAPETVIYQSTDANGNTVFSDQPPRSRPSETVKLEPTNAVPMAAPGPKKPREDKVGFNGYSALAINSPANGATIRNPDKPITVQVTVTPPLQPGDALHLLDNGTEIDGMSLNNPDRGTHVLQAEVIGKNGDVLIQSPSIKIYIHRTSVSQRSGNQSGSGSSSAVASFGSAATTGGTASVGRASSPGSAASTGSAASLGRAASPSLGHPPPK